MFVLFSSHFHQVYRSTNPDSISPSVKKNNHITLKKIKNRIVKDHVFTLDSIQLLKALDHVFIFGGVIKSRGTRCYLYLGSALNKIFCFKSTPRSLTKKKIEAWPKWKPCKWFAQAK